LRNLFINNWFVKKETNERTKWYDWKIKKWWVF
jgi:hypothetical protein